MAERRFHILIVFANRFVAVGARVLGRRFAQMTPPGEAVGVLLPNANGAVLTFFGLQSGGRVAAMLNYTAGPANIASAIRTAKIKTGISSKAFIEKAELGDLVTAIQSTGAAIVWLEELRETVSTLEKLWALLLWGVPIRRVKADDAAVILTATIVCVSAEVAPAPQGKGISGCGRSQHRQVLVVLRHRCLRYGPPSVV